MSKTEMNGRDKYLHEIRSRIGDRRPVLFDVRRWKGQLIHWAVSDSAFKYNLFRFIDVLPVINDDELLLKLFAEYASPFQGAGGKLADWMNKILRNEIDHNTSARIIRSIPRLLAKQFIAGHDFEEAFRTMQQIREKRLALSLDIVGEEVLSYTEADDFQQKYLDLINFMANRVGEFPQDDILDSDNSGEIPKLDISLKVSSFNPHLDPMDWEGSISHTCEKLIPIFESAQAHGISITLDMEQFYFKDLTIEIFKRLLALFPDYKWAGIVMQTYLNTSKEDLESLINWLKNRNRRIFVRLVKGAYWDYETVINPRLGREIPVLMHKDRTDRSYESLLEMVFKNPDVIRPAVAGHNTETISCTAALAEKLGIPKNGFEFQMIYGMAEPIRDALVSMGYRVRAYTPVGELIPGMAYLIRRLLENTFQGSYLRKTFMPLEGDDQTSSEIASTSPRSFINEPSTDFSFPENREAMFSALKRVRENLGRVYPVYIAGREIHTSAMIDSVNPACPEEIIGRVCSVNTTLLNEAVTAASEAFPSWRSLTFSQRADYLYKAARLLRERKFDVAALEILEVGKTWADATGDVAEAIDYLEYYGAQAQLLDSGKPLEDYPGEMNRYVYEPRGTALVISPWNFPLAIPMGMTAAALVTGNCVLFKPAGVAAVTGYTLFELFKSVGLPDGVLQFVPGPGSEIGKHLISNPNIDIVAFTGSKEVGLNIVQTAGQTISGQKSIKRIIAELGGKNAVIIDETADLDEAVKGVVESSTGFQGQKCSACSRVILVGPRYDEFLVRLKEALAGLRIGSTEDPGIEMGPVIDLNAVKKIAFYADLGSKLGKVALHQKELPNSSGFFVSPVILTDIDPKSDPAQDEIFGPVLIVFRAKDLDEALEIAMEVPYALTGGLFSRSPKNIEKIMKEFKVGNLYINRKITGAQVNRQPFGGFAMSGVGFKAGGPDYLLQFLNSRSISENTFRKGFAPMP